MAGVGCGRNYSRPAGPRRMLLHEPSRTRSRVKNSSKWPGLWISFRVLASKASNYPSERKRCQPVDSGLSGAKIGPLVSELKGFGPQKSVNYVFSTFLE